MKKIIYFISFTFLSLTSMAQQPFSDNIQPSFDNSTIKLDCKLFRENYNSKIDFVDVLAISSDCTVFDPILKKFAPMKGSISSVNVLQDGVLGISGDSVATVYASIEKNQKDNTLGDGGGMITFKIQRRPDTKEWKVISNGIFGTKRIYFKNVNFNSLGGTINNSQFCYAGESLTNALPKKFILLENLQDVNSNGSLTGFSDTSDYTFPNQFTTATRLRSVIPAGKKIKKHENFGWPILFNTETGEVMSKIHRMGRGITAITTDGFAFYIIYGGNPSVLARFTLAEEPINNVANLDYPKESTSALKGDGSIMLQAYKQNADGTGDFTIPIALKVDSAINFDDPNQAKGPVYSQIFDSLLVAKDNAIRKGATLFSNIGDLMSTFDENGSSILVITEKGTDVSGETFKNNKDQLALHLKELDAKDGTTDGSFTDYYGRVLAVASSDNQFRITTITEGGSTNATGHFFSNPDKLGTIITDELGSTALFTVKENIPSVTQNRNPDGISFENRVNEAYAFEIGTSGNAFFPLDNTDPLKLKMAKFPFENYKLYQSGSNGSMLSSNDGSLGNNMGAFVSNGKLANGRLFDTYLTVVNGYKGTDKSMILAVRNIYPENGNCVPIETVGLVNEEFVSSNFKIWPNPSYGIINVNEIADYTVIDLSGQTLKSFIAVDKLDLSDLNKGLYFVKKANGGIKKIAIE